jgi:hypothetical protein
LVPAWPQWIGSHLSGDSYHSSPRIANQGDKLLFKWDENPANGYIVVTQPEPDDDQSEGAVRPPNMIESGGSSVLSPVPIDHGSGEAAGGEDDVTPTDPTADMGIPTWFSGSVYVAGPMSGLPEFNYPAFMEAERLLKEKNYRVENPACNSAPLNPTWENYMRLTIPQMLRCRGIALLDGWEDSRGAKLEVQIAVALGDMIVEPLRRWLE